MSEARLPQAGRWPRAGRVVVVLGWAALALIIAGGVAGRVPALGGSRHLALPGADLQAVADEAIHLMARAEEHLRAAKRAEGIIENPEAGPDPSGLIGDEVTPLMTTLGNLEAKRLSANPAWAGALVEQLSASGVTRGDLIAAGFSGSFPGLNLALMAACDALGARLIGISSVTASTWGANQPGFTWPEMEMRLVEAGLLRRASVAIAAGGDSDVARDLDDEGQALATGIRDRVAKRLGIRALVPSDFDDAVSQRLAALREATRGRPIRLYVNVGGAEASLGRSATILRFRSGFLPAAPIGRPSERGVMGRLAAQGVPALLLLNIRDLALRWGVPLA